MAEKRNKWRRWERGRGEDGGGIIRGEEEGEEEEEEKEKEKEEKDQVFVFLSDIYNSFTFSPITQSSLLFVFLNVLF